ncbi:ATP-binding protein [Variovorax gossypii]|uniref:ATP-binding protein n=1 Tax=Variovorax gossypii TaxID=1679495 RepID=A0A431TKQ4_9BURK|nr:ATP-binding protein [Variovorax gossypii]RTQ33679.1 ATP-binding protein [Variovorax gossypii]
MEGYWVLENGDEIGYQAKYHLKSKDVDWEKIDESVTTALKLHRRLRKYVIALACDLTDITAGKGKKGWEYWTDHKKKWEVEARSTVGHDVTFDPWTASVTSGMLMEPNMSGLAAYWFGTLPLSSQWMNTQIHRAVADLDERYHAEDHVHVDVERLFDLVLRSEKGLEYLRAELQRLRDSSSKHLVNVPGDPGLYTEVMEKAMADVAEVLQVAELIDSASWTPWRTHNWRQQAKTAQGSVSLLATRIRESLKVAGITDEARRQGRSAIDRLSRTIANLAQLERIWSGFALQAERDRAILLHGRGGAGKSHLLAHQAEAAVCEGRPVVLVLGQHLRAGTPIWPQILQRLGVEGTPEKFLQALDVSAEAASRRALFLIDALNEGAGTTVWRGEIASFLETFKPFLNVVCVLSCRTEYLPYVLPKAVQDLVQIEIRGFVTPEEQRNAARVYMDRKGIARPSTPWLAEEFTNPLFLRSVCVALQRDNKHEFPRGLAGIKKILAFYVESVARHLVPDYEGSNDLRSPTWATLLAIADAMAKGRCDFLSREAASAIAQMKFASFATPANQTWLEVLQRSGLFRFDPDPDAIVGEDDSLPSSIDVIRFSFQRFQDHLMTEALLSPVTDVRRAFASRGALHFLTDRKSWTAASAGLFEALAVQVPERFGCELVDVLPGGFARWHGTTGIDLAFLESIRLRSSAAFSARTTELFEQGGDCGKWAVSVLLELASIPDHPWNAEGMHTRLSSVSLPQRDSRWSLALNDIGQEDDSYGFNLLCVWCASPEAASAVDQTRELTALALGWCLTSSNRRVRDKATKAITHLMLAQPGVLGYLAERLAHVDDLYVGERLWAAAFAACCLDPSQSRLSSYAQTAWRSVFDHPRPPANLLMRDYARAIVELASREGAGIEGISIGRCKPPYADAAIRLNKVPKLSDAWQKKLSDGASRIVSSCSHFGDFGDYDIKPAMGAITTVPLSTPQEPSKADAFRDFKKSVLEDRPERMAAFDELASHRRLMRIPQMVEKRGAFSFRSKKPSARELAKAEELERRFLARLTTDEVQSFERNAKPWLEDSHLPAVPKIDVARCCTWVALRAIAIGGSAVDKGNDAYGSSSERPTVERLGKKYQWLALSELLCGLTSTLFLESGWGEEHTLRSYDLPVDVGLVRDIDPTVLSFKSGSTTRPEDDWLLGPEIALESVGEAQLSSWPSRSDPGKDFDKLVVRTNTDGHRWFLLYEHAHVTEQYPEKTREHGLRQQEFRRVFSVFVETSQLDEFIAALSKDQQVDVSEWEVPQLIDTPYFGEWPWRATWPQAQWSERVSKISPAVRMTFPLTEYAWESHLDLSLPEGARAHMPAPWLARKLNLDLVPTLREMLDPQRSQGTFIQKISPQGSVALLQERALDRLHVEAALTCVWLLVAERNAWPDGSNAAGTWRRTEGVAWLKAGHIMSKTWKRDGSAANASSAARTARGRPRGK